MKMEKIKVCDAMMGSGKTNAAINYMNGHPDKKFIYITPFLDEAARIRDACPALHFKEPRNDLPDFTFSKTKHIEELIRNGENITSTHHMFLRYSQEMLEMIEANGYTLLIDESVDVLNKANIRKSDVDLMISAGMLEEEDAGIKLISEEIGGRQYDGVFNHIIYLARGNRLVDISNDKSRPYYYWLLSKEIFDAFNDVIIMTYLFEAQTMKYYFDIFDIPFCYIGVELDENGYHFCDSAGYVPEYAKSLSDKIHILDNYKMNAIGKNRCALSSTWFTNNRDSEKIDTLRKNISNFFTYYNRDKDSKHRMWSTFKKGVGALRGNGFYRSNTVYNLKSTNDFRDRDVLAYAVNVFMHTVEKTYLQSMGVEVLEDRYALSVMVQWIWRSAIRDGKEIWIYVPSRRMRELLINWIAEVEDEYKEYNDRRMEQNNGAEAK